MDHDKTDADATGTDESGTDATGTDIVSSGAASGQPEAGDVQWEPKQVQQPKQVPGSPWGPLAQSISGAQRI